MSHKQREDSIVVYPERKAGIFAEMPGLDERLLKEIGRGKSGSKGAGAQGKGSGGSVKGAGLAGKPGPTGTGAGSSGSGSAATPSARVPTPSNSYSSERIMNLMIGQTDMLELYTERVGKRVEGDAGFDFIVPSDVLIPPSAMVLVDMGVRCQLTENGQPVSWLLFARSSIYKMGLILMNGVGVIDAGYTGTVKAALPNISGNPITVKRGERVVQAVSFSGHPFSIELTDKMPETMRGEGGFGSTGGAGGTYEAEEAAPVKEVPRLSLASDSSDSGHQPKVPNFGFLHRPFHDKLWIGGRSFAAPVSKSGA